MNDAVPFIADADVNMQENNRRIGELIIKMDEVGKRPAWLNGGSMNNLLEYNRLREKILNLAIEAFRAGGRFS